MTDVPPHLLTVDVEDWHHTEAMRRWLPAGVPRVSRVGPCTRRLLDLFEEFGVRATFFILGLVAQEEPGLVRSIAAAGHEVATHGHSHRMLDVLGPQAFRRELRDSVRRLEDLAGTRVRGHRAATWSIRRDTLWALSILDEEGLEYDSSVFPCPGVGVAGAPGRPYRVEGLRLVEVPPLLRWGVPAGGGVWLRLLPLAHTRQALRAEPSGVVYVHPWEVDDRPPRPRVPWPARLLQYLGAPRTEPRLRRLLEEFPFCPVAQRLPVLEPLPVRSPCGPVAAGVEARLA